MHVVVVGATGLIGKAVADLLSDKGHEVMRVSRSTQPSVNIDDSASIDMFYKTLGEVDAVICAAGNVSFGSLADLSDEEFQLGITSKLMGEINLVRRGLANVRPGGVFVLTGGVMPTPPWPGTLQISTVNAALEGFVRGAAFDLQDARRIVIVHPPAVREWAAQMGIGGMWPGAATVAETYQMALESQITGEAIFLEGYRPGYRAS